MLRAARYTDIAAYVRDRHGYSVKSCWIADVMEQNGLRLRRAPNRIDCNHRTNPCPTQKVSSIEEALRHYGII
jgi:hypothetical protein